MMDSGWSRLRRRMAWATALVLGAGFLPLAVATAAQSGETRLTGFSTTQGNVRVGGALWDGVTVLPKATRTVTVQYRRAGSGAFKNAATTRTTTRGAATLGLKPPSAGRWQFRAVVAPKGKAGRFVSRTRTVVASGRASSTTISGFDQTAVTVTPGQSVTDDVGVRPGAHRVVFTQAMAASSTRFATISTGSSDRSGGYRAIYRLAQKGLWRVRLVVRASATAKSVTSPTRIITVADNPALDHTAPGRVTGLAAANVTNTAATLSWTNPTDADFTGAVIRRAPGGSAPSSVTDGTAVTDVVAPGNTFTDTGLAPNTRYSYAVFAHDGTPNYAGPATLTLTTLTAPDTAAPAAVSGLRASEVTRTSARLAWVNPTADFTGTVVRRAEGTIAPASVKDGAEVTDAPGFEDTVVDNDLKADSTYTYAVFAHDGTPNYAAAATVRVSTRTAQTDAVLAIRPIGTPDSTTKLTVGVPVEFDASESLPAEGRSNLSAVLDFGDGTSRSFAPDTNGRYDFWDVTHAYSSTGDKNVTLTVTDPSGTDSVPITVHVFAAPTATVTLGTASPAIGSPVTFDLTAARNGATLTSYTLDFRDLDDQIDPATGELSAPAVETFQVSADTAPPVAKAVTFDRPGHYAVTFYVTTDAGAIASGSATFTVS